MNAIENKELDRIYDLLINISSDVNKLMGKYEEFQVRYGEWQSSVCEAMAAHKEFMDSCESRIRKLELFASQTVVIPKIVLFLLSIFGGFGALLTILKGVAEVSKWIKY